MARCNILRNRCFTLAFTESELTKIFKLCDKDGGGLLSKQELREAFKRLGSKLPGRRADRALAHADANGDGFVSEAELEEVVKYASKHGYKSK